MEIKVTQAAGVAALGLAIERLEDRLNKAEVVDQQALVPHEKVAVLGDVEIENGLVLVGLDRFDRDRPADHPQSIAGLELAGHRPALAGFPEAVDAGRDDRFSADRDPERGGGPIAMDGHHGLKRELARRRALRQNPVADPDRFDRSRPSTVCTRVPAAKQAEWT